jgi:hypothetical protein
MEFILMAYVQENGWDSMTPEQQKQGMAAYMAYTKSLAEAGVLKANRRLGLSAGSSTLRAKNGKTEVLDGPYSESKEQLGGFYIIDVKDRAEAMRWARSARQSGTAFWKCANFQRSEAACLFKPPIIMYLSPFTA